jgi:O-antigen/teichoic acid export membrane protein
VRLSEQVVTAIRWDTAGTLVTSLITFLTSIVIVRILGPERFGMLAVVLAALRLLQLMASPGFRPALLRFVPEAMAAGGAAPLLAAALLVHAAAVAIVSAPLLVAPEMVAATLRRAAVAPYLVLLPALLALTLVVDLLGAALVALFRQPVVRSADMANKLAFAIGLAMLPWWDDPVAGVLVAAIGGWALGTAWVVIAAARSGLFARPRAWRPVGHQRWIAFSGISWALTLMGFVLGRELDVLLLTALGVASESIARYAVIFTFVGTVLAAPLLPVSGGFEVPLIARLHARGDVVALRRLFAAFFEYIYIFVLPLVGIGVVVGPALVGLLYGRPYADAALPLAVLMITLGLAKLAGVTGPFLLATDRERPLLRVRLATAAVNIALAVVLVPRFGVLGAAIATGLALTATTVWEAWLVQRFLAPSYPWRFVVRIAFATAVAMIATYAAASVLPEPRWPGVIMLAVVGGATYVLLLLWLKPVSPAQGRILEGGRAAALASIVTWFERSEPRVAARREA